MGLASGIKQVANRAKIISSEVVSILNKIVDQYSDGNISEDLCNQIAKDIDKIYISNGAQPVRNIDFFIVNKKMIAEISFLSVDIPIELHESERAFSY